MTLPLQAVQGMDSVQNNFDTVAQTFPINSSDISDNAITTAAIADNAVTTAKILDANVTTAKLATNAVTTVKITDASVTGAKLAAGAAANTFLSARATTTLAGALGGDIKYTGATITLTAGTWIVTAGGAVINLTTADDGVAGIWNATTVAEVASSRGGQTSTTTTAHSHLISMPVSMTVTVNTNVHPLFARNGGSTLRAQSAASGAAGYITAIRIA